MVARIEWTVRWAAALMALVCVSAQANPSFSDKGGKAVTAYLPTGVSYDPSIPTPESVLGSEVGTWHVRHDQLVNYMHVLANASDRVSLEVTGYTHEHRPLLLLTITAPNNRDALPQWRENHLKQVNEGVPAAKDDPLFLYMGYSIHGNEPSGANAALVVAYYLAAAQDEQVSELLSRNVVLLDPVLNPDGLSRFAQWANMHKSKNLVADSENREHREGWPSGRANHYWFDLNRDWLLLTHPESQARIRQFQKWRPNILTDHHEMGPDNTYFFQPGVPSRKNPNTPDGNVRLTEALGAFHAKAFDKAGQLYFSEEAFDDFYYGKGSSYPDALGSIGILFEQASSRGHVQNTVNGELTFAQTIQNQVTTSLSTIAGAMANKPALLNYQKTFYDETQAAIADDDDFGAITALPQDHGRVNALLSLLDQHHIDYGFTQDDTKVGDKSFPAGSLVVSYDQPKYRLVKSLFSSRQDFAENTFYDVSNWNIALAFNLDYALLDKRKGKRLDLVSQQQQDNAPGLATDAYAYGFEWNDYFAPAMLQHLLAAGVQVKSALSAFTATLSNDQQQQFSAGSIVIPMALTQPDETYAIIQAAAKLSGVKVYAMKSGLTAQGADLGSRTMKPVRAPHILLVGGNGTSSYEAGEVWHYLDTRVGVAPTIVEKNRLSSVNLGDYTHIIFVSGSYRDLVGQEAQQIDSWIDNGGVLIGQKSALKFFAAEGWLDAEIVSSEKINSVFPTDGLKYKDKSALAASKIIAGAVYEAEIDPSHPLFFGYQNTTLPMFKTNNMIVRAEHSPFYQPGYYSDSPLIAGFSAPVLQDMIADSAAVLVRPKGKGVVIGFVDNTLFRGYWYGTGKLMGNAIYQSTHLVR
ncbi:M14 family zinc carboxypeptidase [Alteromonas sp. C1M14]|uniref:M14 family zinc carboxypeptidase n=1 Tax=Alteromonas sp. C1M14 TaxID=2841567 RepID=UPI001C08A64A|nr:M14 family zinc carboxypeptidase [Alteromonas sp. C1M14]MBU2978363.1 peptidase M14 [Alteromonas sp. C1M14]